MGQIPDAKMFPFPSSFGGSQQPSGIAQAQPLARAPRLQGLAFDNGPQGPTGASGAPGGDSGAGVGNVGEDKANGKDPYQRRQLYPDLSRLIG